jgi:hypothetical protein
MKFLKYIFLGLITLSMLSCGEDGAIGPEGDPGRDGTPGLAGNKGPTGDKGSTGPTGPASSSTSIANLFISSWKKPTWKFEGIQNQQRVFEGEVAFAEISNEVLNKALIRAYYRVNGKSSNTGSDDYPDGIIVTVSNSSIVVKHTLRGYKEGKLLIRATVESSQNNTDVIPTLNALPLEFKINIIK